MSIHICHAVYINTPTICPQEFTGISAPYKPPPSPVADSTLECPSYNPHGSYVFFCSVSLLLPPSQLAVCQPVFSKSETAIGPHAVPHLCCFNMCNLTWSPHTFRRHFEILLSLVCTPLFTSHLLQSCDYDGDYKDLMIQLQLQLDNPDSPTSQLRLHDFDSTTLTPRPSQLQLYDLHNFNFTTFTWPQ